MTSKCFTFFILLLFAVNASGQNDGYKIIPKPVETVKLDGVFEINTHTQIIAAAACLSEAEFFADWLSSATNHPFKVVLITTLPVNNFIFFNCNYVNVMPLNIAIHLQENATSNQNQKSEAYNLDISPQRIEVLANKPEGVFYAIQTLRQMHVPDAEMGELRLPYQMECVRIIDHPQYAHRGLLLDCCRHFMSKDFVMKTIDIISQYKMNVLHWHLTEDQGWRIQIDKYPLLTEVGAWRTEADGSRYGGFYTKTEIHEIVEYAKTHHVTIIPEIELPGHSVAAIAAYAKLSCTSEHIPVENEWGVFKDIYCAGNEFTFEFLENVLDEVCELFPSEYIHIGGDEAPKYRWEHCEKCQKRIADEGLKDEAQLQTYFIERIAKYLHIKNKRIIGWDEILEGGIPSDAAVQSWRGMQGGIDAAQAHHQVIMSPTSHCYFDYPLESTDLYEVYSFDPMPDSLTAEEAIYIRGAECNMWSEHAPEELIESKIFPRLIALSEVLWTPKSLSNYDDFQDRLSQQYERLSAQKVDFGFEAVPYALLSTMDVKGDMTILLKAMPLTEMTLQYQLVKKGKSKNKDWITVENDQQIPITEPTTIYVNAEWKGKKYPTEMERSFVPHAALSKKIDLSYTPSPYYSAGGNGALVDGALGSTSFRDGVWQAVNGADMEAVIDLGDMIEISNIKTNWFHYGNAWIFRPTLVEYFVSDDGKNWNSIATTKSILDDKTTGEIITDMNATFAKIKTRYVKMLAHNYGKCPVWHDAVGEPSWLFCDEIVVE